MTTGSVLKAQEEFEYDDDVDVRSCDEDEDQMVIEPPEVRKAPYLILNQGRLLDLELSCARGADQSTAKEHRRGNSEIISTNMNHKEES